MNQIVKFTLAAGAIALMLVSSASAATLNMHNGGDPTSLDPHKLSGDWENRIAGDIFEGLFGGRAGRGGFGGRAAPPQKGANAAYRLAVSFEDAAAGRPQRITLADGKTIDLKLPNGVENGTQMRLSGKGEPGPAGPGDAIVTIQIGMHP